MAVPRIVLVRRAPRRISRLLAWLLAPFVAAFAHAQGVPPPQALPQGGQVRVGTGQILQQGAQLLIQQQTPRLGLDWQRFEIGSDATVRFVQPGATSIAFNRVLGQDASAIYGRLEANGQVFLVNPNGVLFAPGAKVDVGALVASGLDLSQDDFAAGRYTFAGGGGTVLNLGRIAAEGYVALFGGAVENAGEISAGRGGSVVLGAGRAATVELSDTGLLQAVVQPGGSVLHSGRIEAEAGRITLQGALVNTSGLVSASSIVERGGEVLILGEQVRTAGRIEADGAAGGRIVVRGGMETGRAQIGGEFSARALGAGDGGRVETSAAQIAIDAATRVTTLAAAGRHGEWLIDPTDFVVSAGSGPQTSSGIGAGTLAVNLQSGNVTLQTAPGGSEPGDIRVEAPVSWSASTVLTLAAANDVEIRADLTATGNAAGLTVSAGSGRFAIENGARVNLPGSSPQLSINGETFIVINSLSALQAIGDSTTTLARNYALGSDIDASATVDWNDGAGFRPIGVMPNGSNNYFYGDLDGLGHRITGLVINRPQSSYAGLVGLGYDSSIRHVELVGGHVTGGSFTGGVAGYLYGPSLGSKPALQGVRSSAEVQSVRADTGTTYTGGVAGYVYYGGRGVLDSHATGPVLADSYYGYTGGLIGYLGYGGTLADSSASGSVRQLPGPYGAGYGQVGGLVGRFEYTTGRDLSATGAVSGGDTTGGLIGAAYGRGGSPQPDTLLRASASGDVVGGSSYAGGLVGSASSVPLTDVSASGSVSSVSASYTGGLIGYASNAPINRAMASGEVNASSGSYVGGLAGYLYRADLIQGQASGVVLASNSSSAGGLVGRADDSRIEEGVASGSVSGAYRAGGLVGDFYGDDGRAQIVDSRASGDVSASNTAGGLVGNLQGYRYAADAFVLVSGSHASGRVSTGYTGGGLIGELSGSGIVIQDSGATGAVHGGGDGAEGSYFQLGGLIGLHYDYSDYYRYYNGYARSEIRRTHASGDVVLEGATDGSYTYAWGGGLIGNLVTYYDGYFSGTPGTVLSDSYATGAVRLSATRGQAYAGGLIGEAGEVEVTRVYASGAVAVTGFDSRSTGGLLGRSDSTDTTVGASYWNQTTTGQASSARGGTALTDTQMRQAGSFAGWDLDGSAGTGSTWRIYEGLTQPLLRAQLTPLTLTLADASKTYDGGTGLGDAGLTAAGGVVIARPGEIRIAGIGKDVGSSGITAAQVYSTQQGYDLDVTGTATFSIVPRTVTLQGMVADKVYDRSVGAAFVAGAQPTGLVAGEDLTIGLGGASAVFDSRQAGVDKAVTVVGYTVGDGVTGRAANYTVVGSATASIAPKPVSAGGFTATDRAYDGSTSVAVTYTPAALDGAIAGDDLSVAVGAATGTMSDKHAGTAKPVSIAGVTLAGADAANYLLQGLDGTTVTISPRTLTVSGLTASSRTYNASTGITVSGGSATLVGALAGDSVFFSTANLVGQMADRHVGTDKPVTVSGLTLVGADADNYAPQANSLTVNITPRAVTGDVYTIYNNATGNYGWKVYDGSADASAVARVQGSGLYSVDGVTLTATSIAFPDENVAYGGNGAVANRTITASGFALQGQFAGNYVLSNTSDTVSGRILPRPLTVSGVSAVNRVYDGTVNIQVSIDGATVDTSQVVPGDDVAVTLPGGGAVVGTMANKNVGTNKPVTVPGLVLGGADGGNYTLSGSNGVTVNITPKPLTATYIGRDKTYDGTTRALVTAASADIVAGDDVRFYTNEYGDYGCQYYYYSCYAQFTGDGAKNAGTAKPVTIGYEYLYGNDAANYQLLNPQGGVTTANVLARAITPSVTGVNKVYDGTAAATVTLNAAASGVIGGDSVVIGTQNAVFTGGKNAGNAKPIAVTGITLSGTDAANYSLSTTNAGASANITPKAVAVSGIAAVDRVYDGTLIVQVQAASPQVVGLIAGDDVSAVLPSGGITSATMADRHAGQAKPIAVTGLSLTGTDAANYSLTGSAGTVNIAPKAIEASYQGVDRVYNRSVTAQVIGSSTGIVAGVGDSVGFAQTAVFTGPNAKDVGTDKPIAVSEIRLTGAQAGNYALTSTTAVANADVTPLAVSASYTGQARAYNGADDLSAIVSAAPIGLAGDNLGLNQTARFVGDGRVGSNKTVQVTGIELAGVNAGNYVLTATTATTSASITPRLLGVAGMSAIDRVYDGSTTVQVAVTGAQVDLTGVIAGDQVTVSLPPQGITTGQMADKHVGQDKPVDVTGLLLGGADAINYALTGQGALTVDISPLALSASFSGVNKVYDGNANAFVIGSAAFAPGDVVGIAATATFTGEGAKNVGTDKPIAVGNAYLTGADRFNYVLSNRDGSTSAAITPRPLSPVYTGISREYDGTVAAPVSATLVNRVGGDQLAVTQTAVFTGAGAKNVGTAKPIAVTGIVLSGADAGNYTLAYDATSASGTITPRPIVVEGLENITATPRTYDGTVNVAVSVPAGLTGTPRAGDVLPGEQVTVNVPVAGATSGTMADKHAGLAKPVLVTGLGLSGIDAANYIIAGAFGVTVDIAPLTLSAVYSGVDKVYDGGTVAQVTVGLPGRLAGDVLTGSASGIFSGGKNAGIDLAVAVSGGLLSGADARNYRLENPTGQTTADILRRQVSASYTGLDKVYDGTATAQVSGSLAGLVAGDSVTLSQGAVFTAGKAVGVNKAVAVSGIALSGGDAGNYVLGSTTAGASASITPRPLVIEGLTVTAQGREYDGSTTVQVQVEAAAGAGPRPGDVIAGDDLTVAVPPTGATTGTMADKHAGTGKAIVVSGLALGGADAGNYSIVGTSGLAVDIAPRTLTATWTGLSKVYDGTDLASAIGLGDRVLGGDALTIAGGGVFTGGRNVGGGLAIAITSAQLIGADAGNYTLLNPTGSASADITPRPLAVAYAGGTKVYDGNATAPVTGSLNGLIAGDTVGLAQTAVFADGKNVGTGKSITVSGVALTGTDAGNYAIGSLLASANGAVTPRPLVIEGLSASAASREYDGTRDVAVDVIAAGGVAPRAGDVIAGDVVTVSVPGTGQAAGTVADKNVGSGKAVVIAGLALGGADAGNYRIEGVGGVTVDITPRALTATWSGVDKVYDGNAVASALGRGDRVVAGDGLTITGSGVFSAGKNAGSGLEVSIVSALLGGADAGNYTLLNPTGLATASILPRTLTAEYTGLARVYDGSTTAQVSGTLLNLVEGETLALSQSAVFTDGRNAGRAKPVFVAGIAVSGDGASNYRLAATEATTTADVTPRPVEVTGLAGLSAQNREYDGTRSVTLSGAATGLGLQGAIAGDDLRLSQDGVAPTSGTMADKHAGTGKAVVVDGLALAGADAGNYVLGGSVGLTVDIAPRAVTATGLVAQPRLYDGTLAVVLDTSSAALQGVLAGDVLALRLDGATGTLADRHAGQGKAVTVAGAVFDGADAGNYRLQGGTALSVDIAPRPATLTARDQAKTYGEAMTFAGTEFDAQGLVEGETVGRVTLRSEGAAASAGAGPHAISIGEASGGSFDLGNYLLSYQAATLLVNPRPLTLTAMLQSKRYGELLTLAGTEFEVGGMGLANGDTIGRVVLSSAGAEAGAGVGRYTVAMAEGSASGGRFDPANYAIRYDGNMLDVTPRPLTIAAQTVVRYEGEANPSPFAHATAEGGLVNGDALASVSIPEPVGSAAAPGGSLFTLLPTTAAFASGSDANYTITYLAGRLIVLPRPPSFDDPGGPTAGGGNNFFVSLTPEQEVALRIAVAEQARNNATLGGVQPPPSGPAPAGDPQADPAQVLAALLAGRAQQVTLDQLLRLPLLSIDPLLLRRLRGEAPTR